MALKTTLESVKSRLDALLTYANSVTGESDTSIGDAIETLVDGYGQGGGATADDIANVAFPTGAVELGVTTVQDYAFYGNTHITSATGASVTNIKSYGFANNSALTSIRFPNFKNSTSSYQFANCTALTTIGPNDLPIIIGTPNSTFYGCTGLTSVILPNADTISANALRNCSNLTVVDIGAYVNKTGTINANSLNGCTKLTTFIIRNQSMTTLANVNAFGNTPFASGGSGGTIYVPSALISSYQSASNWSTLTGYGTVTWTAIEGSQYEGYYADGTAIE